MQADTAVILLKENDQVRVRASIGIGEELHSGYSTQIGQGFGGIIAQTLKPLYIADAQADPRVIIPVFKRRGIRTMLGVPIKANGNFIGVLHVDSFDIHRESEHELRLLEITADRCAAAIVNAQLFEKTNQMQKRLEQEVSQLNAQLHAGQAQN